MLTMPIHVNLVSAVTCAAAAPPVTDAVSVRSIRKLSTLKPSSTPTCSRTHHHPQQPPRNPRGEGRWSRRVVPRGSPDLKSGASRPSLSIRCTGKRDVSRVLSHVHKHETAGRRGDGNTRSAWWTDMPSCWGFRTLRHAQVQHAQQSVPCLVLIV